MLISRRVLTLFESSPLSLAMPLPPSRLFMLYFALLISTSYPALAQDADENADPTASQQNTEENEAGNGEAESADSTTNDAESPFRRLTLPPPTNLRYAQQQKWDIERSITADAYESALVNNEEVLFIINEANLAITKGVAIIIGEAGKNSLSHHSMSQLVEPLNDFGWVTVMVAAPTTAFSGEHSELISGSPTEAPAPSETETANANQSSPNRVILPQSQAPVFKDDDFLRHETQLTALMEQAVSYSSRYPGFFLVIAKGTTSAFLAKLYADEKIGQPDALITLGTYWPEKQRNKALAEYLSQIETPVLDLYNSWDNGWTKVMAKQRRIEAERALKLHYRQREIVGQSYNSEQYQYIAKEIYGWLTYMGW